MMQFCITVKLIQSLACVKTGVVSFFLFPAVFTSQEPWYSPYLLVMLFSRLNQVIKIPDECQNWF